MEIIERILFSIGFVVIISGVCYLVGYWASKGWRDGRGKQVTDIYLRDELKGEAVVEEIEKVVVSGKIFNWSAERAKIKILQHFQVKYLTNKPK